VPEEISQSPDRTILVNIPGINFENKTIYYKGVANYWKNQLSMPGLSSEEQKRGDEKERAPSWFEMWLNIIIKKNTVNACHRYLRDL
jgi:hypothetical protein